jgi:long-subunit fatty acid transport protein
VDPQNPAGYVEYHDAVKKNAIFSVSMLASHQFINLLSKGDGLSVGLQMNINSLRIMESVFDLRTKLNDEAVNWKFGLGYTYHNQSIEKLQFGITYESKINFSGYYEDNGALIAPPGAVKVPSLLTYPAKLNLGFLLESTSVLSIYNDFAYNFWEDMNSFHKNKLDVSGGIVLRAISDISVSIGYYLSESYVSDELVSPVHSDEVFISGGLILTYGQADVHLVLADSHFFSGENSKQTIGKMGIGLSL